MEKETIKKDYLDPSSKKNEDSDVGNYEKVPQDDSKGLFSRVGLGRKILHTFIFAFLADFAMTAIAKFPLNVPSFFLGSRIDFPLMFKRLGELSASAQFEKYASSILFQIFTKFAILLIPSYILSVFVYEYFYNEDAKREKILRFVVRLAVGLIATGAVSAFIFFVSFSLATNPIPESALGILSIPFVSFSLFVVYFAFFLLVLLLLQILKKEKWFSFGISVLLVIFLLIIVLTKHVSPIKDCNPQDRMCIEKIALAANDASLCQYAQGHESFYCYAEMYETATNDAMCVNIKDEKEQEKCRCFTAGVCDSKEKTTTVFRNLLTKWSYDDKNTADFMSNEDNKTEVERILNRIKKDKGHKSIDYNIFSGEQFFVIKLKFDDDDYFFCDGSYSGPANGQTKIQGDNFTAKSSCSGQSAEQLQFEGKIASNNIPTKHFSPLPLDGYREPTPISISPRDEHTAFAYGYYSQDFSNNKETFIRLGYFVNSVADYDAVASRMKSHQTIYGKDFSKIDLCGKEGDFGFVNDATQAQGGDAKISSELAFFDGAYFHQIEGSVMVNRQKYPNFVIKDVAQKKNALKNDSIRLAKIFCEKYK